MDRVIIDIADRGPAPANTPAEPGGRLVEALRRAGRMTAVEAAAARKTTAASRAGLARHVRGGGLVPDPELPAAPDPARDTPLVDLDQRPSDPALAALLSPEAAVALSAVPYGRVAGRLVVVTSRPDLDREIRQALPDEAVVIALAPRDAVATEIGLRYGTALARRAESRAPADMSCRVWNRTGFLRWLLPPSTLILTGAALAPQTALALAFALAGLVFAANMVLKITAAAAALRARHAPASDPPPADLPLRPDPVITLLVPLFGERDVAHDILARIDRLDWPRSRLDVIFVLEEGDETTRGALNRCALPHWARAISVPPGHPQTKPRALNYALPFARGSIVGIYDAEDAPEPDQLRKVAARFAAAPPGLGCLQGQLDYYNAGHNWIARAFTIEYATWFRLMLPGIQRLGLSLPLGGTTLFIPREALVRVGAWDAHNVTEDAELGFRLARAGYRTEIVETTTFEEANSALLPWIRQRSRWLKGYAITWATAMRRPGALWRELGPWRFLGFQLQLLGTVLGFLTAPLLWSLAAIPLGLPHPVVRLLGPEAVFWVSTGFTLAFVMTLAIGWMACAAPHLRPHRAWLPLLVVYYPLGTIATVAALFDLVARPFYWAKTAHGRYGARSAPPASA
ncbi:glycosyltransferase [Rhodobacterales bacterium HKCCE3408]|nr:glycosyltransferase [Rhodobacterales bacterium HKCCE3408]